MSVQSSVGVSEVERCLDWAVIGGGLAGSYAAWRLHQIHPNTSIVLYEMSGRVGGPFHTVTFPNASNTHLELGASYFLPEVHLLMNRTVHQLGLDIVASVDNVKSDDALYHFRGQSFRAGHLNSTDIPYHVDKNEQQYFPYELYRFVSQINYQSENIFHWQ